MLIHSLSEPICVDVVVVVAVAVTVGLVDDRG